MNNQPASPGDAEREIFLQSLEFELPEQRAAYLERACANDPALRRAVEMLLQNHEEDAFMQPDGLQTLPLPALEKPGDRIGRYKLLEQIGEGGCGVVYMAEQEVPIRRQVALKVIKLGMDTRNVIARFEAERQALALMDHPNIAKVLDAGATETGRPYFVMELVRGIKITDHCDENDLPTRERLQLFILVCQAIQHAHQKGIIHRDIKPSNILVTLHDGVPVPKVIDFGIAKATTEQRLADKTLFTAFQQFLGTPAYMSPEQAEMSGLGVDTRSDIYSLGVLLYELLTGQTPFDSKSLQQSGLDEIRRIIREEEPIPPSTRLSTMVARDRSPADRHRRADPAKLSALIRGDLDWIVMKAMEKDRARRYETANGLAMDVQCHLADEPVVARPPSTVYRFQKLVRRHKFVCVAVGAVAAALILGTLASTWEAVRATRAEQGQSRLRSEAEANARQAEASATEAETILAKSDFLEATRLAEADDAADAVPYLARILSADPENSAALTRLAMLLTYHSWMIPTITLKHGNWVSSAEFSADGQRIVTASRDKTARVWDAQTGQPLTEPLQHGDYVNSAQFSPDGRLVVTASQDNTAQIWDAQTGRPFGKPLKHDGPVYLAQFSPDGKRVVTASADHTARVWDAQTGQPLTEALNHRSSVLSAQFSPDGRRVVTASEDHTARVWDAQSGRPLTDPLQHEGTVLSAQFSPEGLRIVTASKDHTARVWDAQTGRPLTNPVQDASWVNSAQFSPDGKSIVTASRDHTARVWDAQSGRLLIKALEHGRGLLSAQFSPDGQRIVTASDDNTARVWDTLTGQPVTDPLIHGNVVLSARFSPDGKRVVTTSQDDTARVWDMRTSPPLALTLQHEHGVMSAQFSRDGKRVVTASADHTARVWDAQTGQPLTAALNHGSSVLSAQFSPDGRRVVTASEDFTARVWDAQTGQPITKPLQHGDVVTSAAFSPDGRRVVTGSDDHTARVWDAETGQALTEPLKHEGPLTSAVFSQDGKCIVTSSKDHTARVWDAQTGRPLTAPLTHGDIVTSATFSPDGKRVVTASYDATARVWDAQSGQPLAVPLDHGGTVYSAQFSPDGKRVVTGSYDKTARVWDAQTGQPLTAPMQHREAVVTTQFSPDGKWVITASRDGTARLWDAQTGQPLTDSLKHRGSVRSAQFSPDGKRILTASDDYTARVWDVGLAPSKCPAWLLQLAEALSGKWLNDQGVLEPTRLNRDNTIAQIRLDLENQPDNGEGVQWGRWVLANRSDRPISPFSSITVSNYLQNRIKEHMDEPVAEAEELASGNAELTQQVLEMRSFVDQTNRLATLQSKARELAGQGKLIEAEARYRELLQSNREVWTNEPAKWESSLNGLVDVLMRQHEFDGAEQVFSGLLTPGLVIQPQTAFLLRDRGDFLARRGQWKEAAADFSRAIEFDPGDHWLHFLLGSLLAQSGDVAGYRRHCTQALARFGTTNDPVVAERMAKICLILPNAGIDLDTATHLADIAVTLGMSRRFSTHVPHFEFAKGLAEYRQGHFASAVDWMQKALANPDYDRDAQPYLVLAMARQQSGQPDESRAALAKGADLIETKLPKLESGDLGSHWSDWIITHVLLKEAQALTGGTNISGQ